MKEVNAMKKWGVIAIVASIVAAGATVLNNTAQSKQQEELIEDTVDRKFKERFPEDEE